MIYIDTNNIVFKSNSKGLGYMDRTVNLDLTKSPCVRVRYSKSLYYNPTKVFD